MTQIPTPPGAPETRREQLWGSVKILIAVAVAIIVFSVGMIFALRPVGAFITRMFTGR